MSLLQEEAGHPRRQLLQRELLTPYQCDWGSVQRLVTQSTYLELAGSRERIHKHLTLRSHYHTTSLSPYLLPVARTTTNQIATYDPATLHTRTCRTSGPEIAYLITSIHAFQEDLNHNIFVCYTS
ncbi:hypothetical protein AZE42_08894 [Rhizopogon vesiculosus]|uniref:Uncharacterized protein n=1 Tax=Rhizopogon vesiculosus TaxID=180088 RepID=A0A1J8QDS7_9AGAM|nr:hypothetical protein AZE42_08894 [Rhizopogon vesiculosus]